MQKIVIKNVKNDDYRKLNLNQYYDSEGDVISKPPNENGAHMLTNNSD